MTTIRQLRFLVALADTLNFSRAAERCHVTQSTLSTGLKDLEARLGVELAERTRQSVLMTPIGLDIAERARNVLAEVSDIEARARTEAKVGTTLLRMGSIPTIGPFLMPRALPLIRETYPEMKVFLREELTDSLVQGLTEGRLDLLLIALPHDLPPQIVTMDIFEDGYLLAAPSGHPMTELERIAPADLQERRLLLLEPGHCLQRHALSSFPDADMAEDPSFSATSLPTLMSMVEEGLGITLLPKLAVAAGATKGHDLSLMPLPEAIPRRVVLAWRRSSAQTPLFRKIGGILRRAYQDLNTAPSTTV